MIVFAVAGGVLVLQALCALNVTCDPDGTATIGERIAGVLLAAASLLGAFALFGWVG